MTSFMVGDGSASPDFLPFPLSKKHRGYRVHAFEQGSPATHSQSVVLAGAAEEAIDVPDKEPSCGVIQEQESRKRVGVAVRKRQGDHTHGNPCSSTSRHVVLAELQRNCERSEVQIAHGDASESKVLHIGFKTAGSLGRKT